PSASPGTSRQRDFIHYGVAGKGAKSYLQAALHADEIPGLLVIHKLIRLLNLADEKGEIGGHIVLAPIANPIGNSQHFLGELAGRYDFFNGINFNRDYPDMAEEISGRIENLLSDDANSNTELIRATALQILAEQTPLTDSEVLKHALVAQAIDADIALDLHCDWQSVLHIYTGTPIWPQARDLAAYLGAKASLLAEVSGGNPFDEALSGLWWKLATQFPDKPIKNACMAATIELRGKADVEEAVAERDALAIFHYMQSCGIIKGQAPAPPDLKYPATPLDGVEKIIAPIAGVVSYNKQPGDEIKPGDVVCTLFDITQYDAQKARTELTASVAGVMYARRLDRLTRPGQVLCRIAGSDSMPGSTGLLLSD
ncbi:MAG: succinylglutamate desuccinylase/aspartoacylase family protein, partial [Proteobacteria bacterium]|nr:succinylglutamate desuccinylase/aspartoacylase family protein [Pseudomonadota bacterium]